MKRGRKPYPEGISQEDKFLIVIRTRLKSVALEIGKLGSLARYHRLYNRNILDEAEAFLIKQVRNAINKLRQPIEVDSLEREMDDLDNGRAG